MPRNPRQALPGATTALACVLAATAALAHAKLEKTHPAAGGAVSSPSEIRLKFTEGLEPKFSGIALRAKGDAEQPLGAVTADPADNSVLIVKIAKPLPPGVYTVNWRAVSFDTHRTQGSFDFTVKP
jgi:copper resistance protein C